MGDTPINAGSLEGDPKFLLGQIAALLRDLPERMERFEKATTASLAEIKTGQAALSAKVDANNAALSARVDKVEKKANVATGALTAVTSMAAGLGALWWHRGGV